MEYIKGLVTDGSHIQDKSVEKIALDYTYSLGQIDGIRDAIQMIMDIKEISEEESGN